MLTYLHINMNLVCIFRYMDISQSIFRSVAVDQTLMMSDFAETQEKEDKTVIALESPLYKYSKWFGLKTSCLY